MYVVNNVSVKYTQQRNQISGNTIVVIMFNKNDNFLPINNILPKSNL